METLQQWFAEPAARIITLLGPGCVGKTRLAVELLACQPIDELGRRALGERLREVGKRRRDGAG